LSPVLDDRSGTAKFSYSTKAIIGAIAAVAVVGVVAYTQMAPTNENPVADSAFTESMMDDKIGGGCRPYDFSSAPKDESVKAGGFEFGKTFSGVKNVMTGSYGSTENVMLLKGEKLGDVSVTTDFATTFSSDNFAVGLRYNFYGKAYNDQWCQSYTGYACVINTYQQINSKAEKVKYKYDIRECTENGQMRSIGQSGAWYQSGEALTAGQWYKLKFSAQGANLKCSIIDGDSGLELSTEELIDDTFANVSGYQMIGTYGKDNHYFEEVDSCGLCPTDMPTPAPSVPPTSAPTYEPTGTPTSAPSAEPSSEPTAPTQKPTKHPTIEPSAKPTLKPSTAGPTYKPTPKPTGIPSRKPSKGPTEKPTLKPTGKPSTSPTTTSGMFCSRETLPTDTFVSHGGFAYNETYNNKDCLLRSSENKNNIMMVKANLSNVSLDVSFLQSSNSTYQVSAIMLRSSDVGGYDQSSWCMGQERFVCVAQVRDYDNVKLEFLECDSDSDETEFDETELVAFSQDKWYTQKMTAYGTAMTCELYDDSDTLIQSITANSSDYKGKLEELTDVAFGAYGKDYYFRDYHVSAME